MRTPLLVALALALAVPAVPAGAARPSMTGIRCGLTAWNDPQIPNGQNAVVVGGPLALPDSVDPAFVHEATLSCTVQVNAAVHSGTGNDSCTAAGPATPGAAAAAWSCAYEAVADDNVYLCTQLAFADGTILYFDDDQTWPPSGRWHRDSHARCALATTVSICVAHELCEASLYDAAVTYVLPGADSPVPLPAP